MATDFTTFRFVGVDDTGPESGACCPHCGAEGRYIYRWEEDGKPRAAMAGCYSMLTGKLKKDDIQDAIEKVMVKKAKKKPLSGWDKTIDRMLGFIEQGKYSADWCMSKISEAVKEKRRYAANFGRR